ncbi:hypothetical protein BSKO_11642 [Bryopsis sp. KO-2023]|nr:hypothetical protein BSKO_11642 [Bryopsis sp. KO-2023]
MIPAAKDCEDCREVRTDTCDGEEVTEDCDISEEDGCEPIKEKECREIVVNRCESLRKDNCKSKATEECPTIDEDRCHTVTINRCRVELKETCVGEVKQFEGAIQSVNVKFAADFIRVKNEPKEIAQALSFPPEQRETVLVVTPERTGDPDVVVGKAFATAMLDAADTQVIANRLAEVTVDAILREIWLVTFFLDLNDVKSSLTEVFSDLDAMEKIIEANPTKVSLTA